MPNNKRSHQDASATLALFYLIAGEIHTFLELDAVLHRVLMATASALDTPAGSLYVFDDMGNVTHGLVIKNWQVQNGDRDQASVIVEQGLTGWVMRHQQGVIIANTAQDRRWYFQANEPPRSAIAAPLQTREGVIGVLTLVYEQPGYFNDGDLAMLTVIADQATTAVVNARLYQAEQRRRQLAATMAEISQTISATLSLDRLFDVILEQLARVIDYDGASVLLQQGDSLRVAAARGLDDVSAVLDLSLARTEENLAFQVMRQRQTIVVADVQQHPGWQVTGAARQVHGWIGAPLMTPEEVFGVLAVGNRQARAYAQEDAQVVTTFAHHAAIALTNARLVEQLQAAEMRYARLFEDSTDLILIFDLEGRVLDANCKACEVLQRNKSALVGMDVGALEVSLRARFAEALSSWCAGQEVVLEVELPVAPGRAIPIEFRTKHTDYGGEGSIQWNGRDLLARRELEQLRQDLTNMLVHDMRGPLGNVINVITTIPALIPTVPPESPLAQMLEIALRSGQQVQNLIDSMLDVSRLEQHEVPLNCTLGAVDDLFDEVQEQQSSLATAKQVTLSFLVHDPLPDMWGDQALIRRVLGNLVNNAIKYSPRHGQVNVVASQQEGAILFSVSDQGPGIPPEYQWRIFDKFARVQYAGAPTGVGLGLAFCRLAVEAHGGRIWVESAPGQGSTFHFALPSSEHSSHPPKPSFEEGEGSQEVDQDD